MPACSPSSGTADSQAPRSALETFSMSWADAFGIKAKRAAMVAMTQHKFLAGPIARLPSFFSQDSAIRRVLPIHVV
jgi:hypothetical protein